jgi:archaemetzincin
MKTIPGSIMIICVLLSGCNKYSGNFLKDKNKIIALQPLGDYDPGELIYIQNEISDFYNRPVIILSQMNIPTSYLMTENDERYSADSILKLLSGLHNGKIAEVVGITHKDIFTTRKENPEITETFRYPGTKGIFGMGYIPGNACIISDYRIHTTDTMLLKHRLRTVIFHEIGHNLGLGHCPVDRCIMSGATEKS